MAAYGPSTSMLTRWGQEMVAQNTGLAYHLVYRGARGAPDSVDLDERISVALEALVRAVQFFDPGRGIKFSTFASVCIIKQIQRCYRTGQMMASLETAEGSIDPLDRREPVEDKSDHELRLERLERAIAGLPDRLRLVMRSRLGGETLQAIGDRIGVTKERARQLEGVARRLIRCDMEGRPWPKSYANGADTAAGLDWSGSLLATPSSETASRPHAGNASKCSRKPGAVAASTGR